MASLYPLLGMAVALAGGDKLFGNRAYRRMFRHLDWSESEMQAAAAAEIVGGLLMVPRFTRRLGGALVAATSATVLSSEIEQGDNRLATYRGAVMLAGLAAMVMPGED